jgi:hypothetical protein
MVISKNACKFACKFEKPYSANHRDDRCKGTIFYPFKQII